MTPEHMPFSFTPKTDEDRTWFQWAKLSIGQLARNRESFSSDDLAERCEKHGMNPRHPNHVGLAFSMMVKSGEIEMCGLTKTMRLRGHHRRIGVYRKVRP